MANQRHLIRLTLILGTLQVSLAQEPKLTILPKTILKPVGEGVYVSCEANVDDVDLVTEMRWTAPDGTMISNNNNEPVSTDEHGTAAKLDLIINKLREQDVGEYICSAVYAGNQKLEAKIMVESFMEIDFGDTPTHQKLLIGKEGKIRCTPMGKPAPLVDWYKNMKSLQNDENHIIQQDGILINNVTEADEGTYRCRARVIALGSMKTVEILVEVNIPPVINIPPQNITGRENEEATFECGATGKPAPSFSWVDKDNQPLVNGGDFHVNTETGVLLMMNLKPEQSGKYRCTATNDAGEDFKTAFLEVYTKPKIEEFLNLTVSEGSDLEMPCVMSGSPIPEVIFKKRSESRNFSLGIDAVDDRIRVEQKKDDRGRDVGVLQIKGVKRSDDGLYTCTAESQGGVTQRWGHITVEFSPTFEEQGAVEQWSWEKAAVNLTCLATSIPNATIQWYLRNEEIKATDINLERLEFGPLGVLRVQPTSASYFGVYTCKATNILGTNSLDIELKEAHIPGPITSAKVDKKTATTITWNLVDPADNGGLEIQSYVVEYRLNDQSWENAMVETWVKGSTYTIEKLRPLETYVFRFAAHSRVGDGEWGGEKSEVMPGHAAPEEPTIFGNSGVAEIPYTSHYELQWKIPLNNGKEIDHFQIVYYQVEKKEGQNQWEAKGDKTTEEVEFQGVSSYKIEGLNSNTHYKIELRAHNEIGYSTPAEAIIKTAHDRDVEEPELTDSPNIGLIVAVIIIVIIVVLVVVDITCYCTRNAGITATIKGKRGSKDLKDKETMLEDGKNASDEKHEGNGQMKTEKDDLKPEQQNSDKKESSEPTETTPMIQGRALQGIAKDPQPWRDRNEVSLAPLKPAQLSSFEMLYDDISGPEDIQPNKPVIVECHKKNMREENVRPSSVMRYDVFNPTIGTSMKNSTSSPLLDQSYSDDSLYAKPFDVPRDKAGNRHPHLNHSQEVLSDRLQGTSPATYRQGNPFIHKNPKVQPITLSMEDMTYDRSETPHYRSNHEPNRSGNPFRSFGSREMLLQESQSPSCPRGSREALSQASPGSYHMSRSREALNQGSPGSYHMSRSREALNQASPWPNHSAKQSGKQNDALRIQSLMSNSREMLNDPSRFPMGNFNVNRTPKAPSVSSCSTHYQPTDAALQQPMARTAFQIAPYDDPDSPARHLPQNPHKGQKAQGKGALQNLNPQPYNKGIKIPFMDSSPGQIPKRNDKWSIPAPPPRASPFTTRTENKNPFTDTLQHPSYSYSMDNLDSTLDSHQPSGNALYQHPLPTTKSLNNLLDDSSSSLRSYGKPTLL